MVWWRYSAGAKRVETCCYRVRTEVEQLSIEMCYGTAHNFRRFKLLPDHNYILITWNISNTD
jgi:hypothetical protein